MAEQVISTQEQPSGLSGESILVAHEAIKSLRDSLIEHAWSQPDKRRNKVREGTNHLRVGQKKWDEMKSSGDLVDMQVINLVVDTEDGGKFDLSLVYDAQRPDEITLSLVSAGEFANPYEPAVWGARAAGVEPQARLIHNFTYGNGHVTGSEKLCSYVFDYREVRGPAPLEVTEEIQDYMLNLLSKAKTPKDGRLVTEICPNFTDFATEQIGS